MSDPVATLRFLLSVVYAGALAPEHLGDLRKSGLSNATIAAHGFRSVPPTMIRALLGGWDVPPDPRAPEKPHIRSAMLIPHPDPRAVLADARGPWMDHVQVRLYPPLPPSEEREGSLKYGGPKGQAPRLYFPRPGIAEVLGGPAEPLWLVEGSKKALAAAQLGLPAVGFPGVDGWHRKGTHDLLPDFHLIPLQGRALRLVPDADVETNPTVARAIRQLADALRRRGARPELVVLPAMPTAPTAAVA
jgi:hypothetical protein